MSDNLIEATSLKQEEYDSAEAALITILRESFPNLDLRRGTALRDLLLRPMSALYALEENRHEESLRNRSLIDIKNNPSDSDEDSINAILSNFNTSIREGTPTSGIIELKVSRPGTYTVAAGSEFVSSEEHVFVTTEQTTVRATDGTLRGPQSDGLYYFMLEVQAADSGSTFIPADEAFVFADPFSGFISATAYSDFTTGAAKEDIDDVIERIKFIVANRGIVTRASIVNTFTDPESDGYRPSVSAVSVQGSGDPAQYRDRHNIYGVPSGGCIDIYPRTFVSPVVTTLIKTGTLNTDGTYTITIAPEEAYGVYAVRSVNTPDAVSGNGYTSDGMVAIGSMPFEFEYTRNVRLLDSVRLSDADSTFGTVYQGIDITVTSGWPSTEDNPEFKIELYAAPETGVINEYVQSAEVKNLAADVLVRNPFVCIVSLRIPVRVSSSVSLDVDAIKRDVAEAINSSSFEQDLSMSSIISVVHSYPVIAIDTRLGRKGGFSMVGSVVDGAGVSHRLENQVLDVKDLEDTSNLLIPETCVFSTSPDRIIIDVTTV